MPKKKSPSKKKPEIVQQEQPKAEATQPVESTEPSTTKKKSSKSCLIISLIAGVLIILGLCCCGGGIGCGFLGSLPDWLQDYYDKNEWAWDEYLEENTSLLKYPRGDVSEWWWTATDEQRQSYITEKGYPYSLYKIDWTQSNWDSPDWYDSVSCSFVDYFDVESWWYTASSDTRDCYIYLYGIPSFLYEDEGAWEETGWYDETNCTFPNGDTEYWWWETTDAVRDCYVWTYGLPYFLFDDSYYDYDYEDYDLSCAYDLDCDHPNGDIEYWWSDVTEAQRACYVYENGMFPYFMEEPACDIPNGNVENWWCLNDEDTRLCYIEMYGLPWFME
jgi:hypothetical protein